MNIAKLILLCTLALYACALKSAESASFGRQGHGREEPQIPGDPERPK